MFIRLFFFSSRRRHTRWPRDWSSDVCSSDLAGERLLLIDADLRRPSVAEHLDLESTAGLTSVLIEEARLEDVTQPLETDGLDVLASGPVPPNPSELLGSQRMKQLLDAAGADYEYVVFDSASTARRHRRGGPLARRGRHGHWSRKAIASSRSSLERPWRRRMPSMPICGDRLCWGSRSEERRVGERGCARWGVVQQLR